MSVKNSMFNYIAYKAVKSKKTNDLVDTSIAIGTIKYNFDSSVSEFKYQTQRGNLNNIINLTIGAYQDSKGVYHIKQNYWQSSKWVGYNDFYEGTSISHFTSSGEVSSIENGKKLIVAFPGIDVETNKDKYIIHFIYNIKNDENPNDIGIYRIDIFHRKFAFQYFGDAEGNEYTKLEEEAPIEMMRQTPQDRYLNNEEFKNYKNYLNAGIGVVTCDEETMRESYLKKNGKEMILYEVDDNNNLIKDENGNKIVKKPQIE